MLLLCAIILNTIYIAPAQIDPFVRATFDCSRIHLSYCCASRIRNSCRQRCNSVQCVSTFSTTSLDTEALESETGAGQLSLRTTNVEQQTKHDGDTLSWRSLTNLKPSISSSLELVDPTAENTPYPTLLATLNPNTDEHKQIFLVTAIPPPQITEQPLEIAKPNSAYIAPPDSFGETLLPLSIPSPKTNTNPDQGKQSLEGTIMSSIDETYSKYSPKFIKQSPTSTELTAKSSVDLNNGFKVMSIKVVPHQTDTDELDENFHSNHQSNGNTETEIGDLFGAYINTLNNGNIPDHWSSALSVEPTDNNGQTALRENYTTEHYRTNSKSFIGSNANCGIAPDFIPCVPVNEANKRLTRCCQSKNLPDGCLHLCRYDISQKEVRNALDTGVCGILHVTPIVQCASGGHDNTNCCRQKNVAAKSGPQCEIFCRTGSSISNLGLQHLVCNNVLNDLLTCHHAGLTR